VTAVEELNPALIAARKADDQVLNYLRESKSFLLEAGAGAGKTYSLDEVLQHLIANNGRSLRRNSQRVACITYTNAATAVINNRIDGNPLVFTDTIHAFCWSLIRGFQPALRQGLSRLSAWEERFAGTDGIGLREIISMIWAIGRSRTNWSHSTTTTSWR